MLDLTPAVASIAIADIAAGEGFFAFTTTSIPDRERRKTISAQLPITQAIEDLELSAKTENALKRAGITTVGELAALDLKNFVSLPGLETEQRKELLQWLIALEIL